MNNIDVHKLKELYRESEDMAFKAIKNHFPLLKRCGKTWRLLYNIYREGMKAGRLLCLSFFKINKAYAHELHKDEEAIGMMKRDVYKAFMSTISNKIQCLPKTYTTRYKKAMALFCWDSIGDGAGDLLSLFSYYFFEVRGLTKMKKTESNTKEYISLGKEFHYVKFIYYKGKKYYNSDYKGRKNAKIAIVKLE